MTQIILTDDQVLAVRKAAGAVELRDLQGNLLGYVSQAPTREEIDAAKQRLKSDGPWHTTEQVLKHLESLEQG